MDVIRVSDVMPRENKYYDATKILSLKDKNGKTPDFFIITTNRTAGKTTRIGSGCLKRYKKTKEKFAILVRTAGELKGFVHSFFNDIQSLFFQNDEMTEKVHKDVGFSELFLNGESCGYVIALNAATKIKRNSHLFTEVTTIWFDEFISEDGYLPDEVNKFFRIYRSIARGHGQQFRYVRVIFTGNPTDLFNPYFVELKICDLIKADTKFLRGDGFVLERTVNQAAIEAIKNSGLAEAMRGLRELKRDIYIYDDLVITEKPSGKGKYLMTLKYNGEYYGIIDYGYCIFCNNTGDKTAYPRFACTVEDTDEDYPHISLSSYLFETLRQRLKSGVFRFKNGTCKKFIFSLLLKYDI